MQNTKRRPQSRRDSNKEIILKMVLMACLISIVIIFQLLGNFIKIGATSVSLVLIPIVIGGALLGPLAGAILGSTFGIVVLSAGIEGVDPFTATLWQKQPLETAILCLGKGALAGFCSGLVYKLLSRFNDYVAIIVASAVAPIVNTGVFILGGLFMVKDTLLNAQYADGTPMIADGTTLVYFLIILCAGFNFIAEFILNIVVSPAIKSIINLSKSILPFQKTNNRENSFQHKNIVKSEAEHQNTVEGETSNQKAESDSDCVNTVEGKTEELEEEEDKTQDSDSNTDE